MAAPLPISQLTRMARDEYDAIYGAGEFLKLSDDERDELVFNIARLNETL